jgi:hypothetical protein
LDSCDVVFLDLFLLSQYKYEGWKKYESLTQSHSHTVTQSHIVTFLSFYRYTMWSIRKKRNSLSFYLLNTYENEFSCIEITCMDDGTTKKWLCDCVNDSYFFHPY